MSATAGPRSGQEDVACVYTRHGVSVCVGTTYVMFVPGACFHHHGPISALGQSEKRCAARGDPRNVHRWSVQFLAALHHQCTLAIVILSVLLSVVIRSWNLTAGVWSSIPSHGRSNLLRGCRPSMCEDCSHANTVEFIDEMFACRL